MKAWKLGAIAPLMGASLFMGPRPVGAGDTSTRYEAADNVRYTSSRTGEEIICRVNAELRINEGWISSHIRTSLYPHETDDECFDQWAVTTLAVRYTDLHGDPQHLGMLADPGHNIDFGRVRGTNASMTATIVFGECDCGTTFALPQPK